MRGTELVLLALTTLALTFVSACLPVSVLPVTTVRIDGEATGFLPAPCNCTAGIVIAINARGSGDRLEGTGTSHATTGATNRFELTGSIIEPIVLLSGTIVDSTVSPIEGSPIDIKADATTGLVSVTLGPLAGGVFAGQTLVFTGSGKVVVTRQ